MTARHFDKLLESSGHKRTRSKGRLSLPMSVAIHIVVLGAFVIVPLLSVDDLPDPEAGAVRAFFVDAAPPPPPPPPPPAPRRAVVASNMPKPKVKGATETRKFVAPIEVPENVVIDPGIAMGSDFGLPAGEAAGVEGGVDGGIPGGVVGGVVGGVLGGVLESQATPPPPPPPTAPPAPSPGPVRVGGQIKEPIKIHHVPPAYPDIARYARIQGIVVLEAIIGSSGAVQNVRVLRGVALLNDAATEAVRQWRYTPTMLNGIPVPVIMTVTIDFRLAD